MPWRLVVKRDKKVGIIVLCVFIILALSIVSCLVYVESSMYITEMQKAMMKKNRALNESYVGWRAANITVQNLTMVTENLTKEKNNLTTALVSTSECLNSTMDDLENTEDMLIKANSTIDALRKEISYARQGDSYMIHDPTYAEMVQFLAQNDVNNNTYGYGYYMCRHFAKDLKNDATMHGIRCAYVEFYGPPPDDQDLNSSFWKGHALNGFDTIDEGFVYIEPQTDGEREIYLGATWGNIYIKDLLIIW